MTRASYRAVGAAMRQALARAHDQHERMTDLDWRVLTAVLSRTVGYSRLTDTTHATVIAEMADA